MEESTRQELLKEIDASAYNNFDMDLFDETRFVWETGAAQHHERRHCFMCRVYDSLSYRVTPIERTAEYCITEIHLFCEHCKWQRTWYGSVDGKEDVGFGGGIGITRPNMTENGHEASKPEVQ